jgi:tetratricopeptide (TPR) repeat protein
LSLEDWRDTTVAGLRAFADGRRRDAAESWLRAGELINSACGHDALLAAAENNVGVAYLLDGDPQRAAEHFARAARLWDQSRNWIECAEPELASSSVFHLRLAMDHHVAFTALRRGRYLDLCDAGRKIAEFNASIATAPEPAMRGEASLHQSMIEILSSAFGPNSAEVRIVCSAGSDGLAAYGDKAARLAEWPARSYLDTGQYLANVELAAHMSVLLHSRVLPPTIREPGSGNDD